MSSRLRFLVLTILIASFCFASTSFGLEKTVARFTDDGRDVWDRATTPCLVVYYNLCQGWVWIWSGWSPGDRMGVWFQSCCPTGYDVHQLNETVFNSWTGSPSGYGFTGTIDVWTADGQGCPTGAALYSQSYLPISGWNTVTFPAPIDVSGSDFVISYTLGAVIGDPLTMTTDHPLAGPTGPPACGTCYPTTRVNHTFYYGTATTPLCPGSFLNDGLCDAQFLWDCALDCATPVELTSWGTIKQLYR